MPRLTPPPEIAAQLPPELLEQPIEVLLDGADEAARADLSPIRHVTTGAPPFLLVHGTVDDLVPFAQSEALEAALSAAGVRVRLVPVEGAGHIFHRCDDVEAVVRLSVEYLAHALRTPQRQAG
ncbi:alpha/beta hydrolase family protein [Pseudonocardia nigra]|uniref:alpha/beta hydrolase family protein n=1 Tax=Pseudonocardia nigra TaxID=1921578 RepID=UPI001C5EB5B7|nr:prolyl oligopeptidase family serine peptidase [Pseudonocardia nigra]